ncbi:HAMP domain-containing sensor histidine kinase [Rossellomorea marisflavi]|uniref:sensor histidine kinase n=1 Tax=Rossellomorea marisflavi TaxID=189381 RepID=UPI00285315C9|nr:HAMP domain-containing sensor histidine kinase [Rossellomorea marisflavi]MDR4938097.1 HAMP domain-containing sensor histidine kinase [Rossellomorea marisflavi]
MSALKRILSKFMALNSAVLLLVIFLAGFSVKEYACYVVNAKNITGSELRDTLNDFVLIISCIVFLASIFFHYLSAKRILVPIRALSSASEAIKEGRTPDVIPDTDSGELKELIRHFNAMAETIRNTEEQRDKMMRDIAHELRTPLTNLNGYLEAMENGVITGNSELFGSLLEESKRMTRIVELITELNAWNTRHSFLDAPFRNLDVSEVLQDTINTYKLRMDAAFKRVEINLTPLKVQGDRDGLTQVFTNILQNVIDYNVGKDLHIQSRKAGTMNTLVFTHTGQHIPTHKQEMIFERFHRLEESRSTRSDGAGLGLTISRSIITAHGGTIAVETDGHRHQFIINLPNSSNLNNEERY